MGEHTGLPARLGMSFRDRALYLREVEVLVIADLHLGKATSSAVDAPLGERDEVTDRLMALIEHFGPAEVIIAGDVLHAFDTIPRGVTDALETLREAVEDRVESPLRLVSGNHDAMLEDLANPITEHRLCDGRTVVCHGHERPETNADRYILGHDHPAIDIEGTRYPCFLYGNGAREGVDVLMLPAFNRLTIGTAVNRLRPAEFDAPLLQTASRLRPILHDESEDETLVFPPLDRIRGFL